LGRIEANGVPRKKAEGKGVGHKMPRHIETILGGAQHATCE
jgi:hypothetical protein